MALRHLRGFDCPLQPQGRVPNAERQGGDVTLLLISTSTSSSPHRHLRTQPCRDSVSARPSPLSVPLFPYTSSSCPIRLQPPLPRSASCGCRSNPIRSSSPAGARRWAWTRPSLPSTTSTAPTRTCLPWCPSRYLPSSSSFRSPKRWRSCDTTKTRLRRPTIRARASCGSSRPSAMRAAPSACCMR